MTIGFGAALLNPNQPANPAKPRAEAPNRILCEKKA